MSRRLSFPPSLLPSVIACALLLMLAFLQLSSLAVTSVTIDEPSHVMAGYAFLTRGDTRLMLNGPILPNALGAAPLLTQPDLKLTPADDPMWEHERSQRHLRRFHLEQYGFTFHVDLPGAPAVHLHQLAVGRVDLPLGVRARRRVGGCLCVDALRLRSEFAGAFASGDDRLRADGAGGLCAVCVRSLAAANQQSQVAHRHRHLHGLDAGLQVLVDHVRRRHGDLSYSSLHQIQSACHPR